MERRNFLARLAALFALPAVSAKQIAPPPLPAIGDEPVGTIKMIVGDYIPPGWKLAGEDCAVWHDHTHHLTCSESYAHSHVFNTPVIPLRFIVRV